MWRSLGRRENIPLISAIAIILSLVLAWLAPAEATLGKAVKLVYLHAAIMWVGLGLLTIGGAAGILYVFWRKKGLIDWSCGSSFVGIVLVFITGMLGAITAKITWGAIYWAEPRMAMLGWILVTAAAVGVVIKLSGSNVIAGLAVCGLAAISWTLLIRTERVVHPGSPIFNSDSLAIKVFPLLITVFMAIASLQIVRYWTTSSKREKQFVKENRG